MGNQLVECLTKGERQNMRENRARKIVLALVTIPVARYTQNGTTFASDPSSKPPHSRNFNETTAYSLSR
jgi:hypothetical protein